jgi:hypothetical protein
MERIKRPIKATARVPIKQAGYISATSDIQQNLSCDQQPVHTSGSLGDIVWRRSVVVAELMRT